MTDEWFMQKALTMANKGVMRGQLPFGACVVQNDTVLAETCNEVALRGDPTAHAELLALQTAAHALKQVDLSGTALYSTCEPCPMCLTACVFAKIGRIVFSCTSKDASDAGLSQVPLTILRMNELLGSHIEIEEGLLHGDGIALLYRWHDDQLNLHHPSS